MPSLRVVAASIFVVALAIACGGAQTSGGASRARQSAGDVCPATIAPSVSACPAQVVPPGDGSSERCKSDADCTGPYGTDGRCIKNPIFGELEPRRDAHERNLLGGPPEPPSRSICVFDTCHADAECGPQMKCVCGTGRGSDRNHCVPLDRCRADRDCRADNVCLCGTGGNSNYCVEGDCHQDADCDDGFKCEGSHCHTKKDTCRSQADCPPTSDGPRTCRWGRESKRWDCHVVPPIPPG